MRTLTEFNGIHDPKINLIQVCWDLNELITMEDLLQGNKTINQLDHNAYTWRRAKEVYSQQRMVNSLKSWKFNQEPRLSNQNSATMLKILSKVFPKIIPKEYLYSKPKP